jgi:hypothetical protein
MRNYLRLWSVGVLASALAVSALSAQEPFEPGLFKSRRGSLMRAMIDGDLTGLSQILVRDAQYESRWDLGLGRASYDCTKGAVEIANVMLANKEILRVIMGMKTLRAISNSETIDSGIFFEQYLEPMPISIYGTYSITWRRADQQIWKIQALQKSYMPELKLRECRTHRACWKANIRPRNAREVC